MFGDRKFVLTSPNPELEQLIADHQGSLIQWKDRYLRETTPQLVIISDNIDFENYDQLNTMMVPTVTAQWVFDSIDQGKQLQTKPYSPDPRHFMKSVVICPVGLSPGDTEGFKAGIKAAGGSFNDILTVVTTHVIATELDNDICITAREDDEHDIKIVSPEWFDDCMKLGRKVDESPYFLSSDDAKRAKTDTKSPDLFGTFNTEPTDTLVPQKAIESSVKSGLGSNVFSGRTFYLGKDLDISEKMQKHILYLIEANGGEIAQDLTSANTYLGKWRQGEEYIYSAKHRYVVGNLLWLYWMALQQKWELPTKYLLHYPEVPGGMADMKDKTICITNYTGEARSYLQTLILSIGANYTGTMCQATNTHLIAAYGHGPKYDAAKNWGIKIVNHLWLEDSYSKWMLQDVNLPRYQYLPKNLDLTTLIGTTALSTKVLRQFYTTQSTPIIERHLPMRAARDKAQQDVHTSVLKENLFRKMQRQGEQEEPEQEPAKTKKPVSQPPPAKQPTTKPAKPPTKAPKQPAHKPNDTKQAPEARASEPETHAKRQKLDAVKIITTGVDSLPAKTVLTKLGIKIVESGNKADIIVAPKILRTQKFLCSLANADNILTPDWLKECVKKGKIVGTEGFQLENTGELLNKSYELRRQNRKLLQDEKFRLSPSVRGGPQIVEQIIKAHGGKVLKRDGKGVIYVKGDDEESDTLVTLDYLIEGILNMQWTPAATAKDAVEIPKKQEAAGASATDKQDTDASPHIPALATPASPAAPITL